MHPIIVEIKKNTQFKYHILLIVVLTTLLFSACELFLNEAAECIIKVKPVLPDKNLASGTIGVEYTDYIKASAKNHVNDDDFAYHFNFIGRPPKGISYYFDNRTIYFNGTPIEKGEFSFVVILRIGDGALLDDDGICFSKDETQKKYVITID